MEPIHFAMKLIAVAGVTASVACNDEQKVGGGCPLVNSPIDLSEAACDSHDICHYIYGHPPQNIRGATIGLDSCGSSDDATFFGSWQLDDASSRAFKWRGPVRIGGMFPSRGYLASPVQCTPADRCYPYPTTTVAVALTGSDWPKLDDDDVFIPLHGLATIDHAFHASATLDDRGDAAGARATIFAEGVHGAKTTDAGVGDAFPWGRSLASVVRIVEPQDGVLGPVGWVEIKLSDAKPDAGARR